MHLGSALLSVRRISAGLQPLLLHCWRRRGAVSQAGEGSCHLLGCSLQPLQMHT